MYLRVSGEISLKHVVMLAGSVPLSATASINESMPGSVLKNVLGDKLGCIIYL